MSLVFHYLFIIINVSFKDDLTEIIIKDCKNHLPGPPPPPVDLLQPYSENHWRHRQSSSPPSQHVLVARGTACQVSGIKDLNITGCAPPAGWCILFQCSHLSCFGLSGVYLSEQFPGMNVGSAAGCLSGVVVCFIEGKSGKFGANGVEAGLGKHR